MKQNTNRKIRRVTTFGLGLALGLSFLTGTASAAPTQEKGSQGKSSSSQTCDGSPNSNTGHGANQSGPYNNTCPRNADSANGNGGGGANGRPCAGCVGNADDKNPPGQQPGPQDHNNGYECDGNHGIAKGNPAHTSCGSTTPPPPPPGGDDDPTPACPAGKAAMTAHSYKVDGTDVSDLTGNVHSGDTVKANFTISANCPTQKVSLVSYKAKSKDFTPSELSVHKSDTGTFGPGEYSLTVTVPKCFFQVDFVLGDVITKFESGMTYGDRLIDEGNGGSSCVKGDSTDPIITPTPGNNPGNTPGNNPGTITPAPVVIKNGTSEILPAVTPAVTTEGAPLGTSVLAADLTSAAPAAPVVGSEDLGAPAVSSGTSQPKGRPTRVLGVQLERGAVASSSLARTGFTLLPLVALGTILSLLGVVMTSAKRKEAEFVVVADRIAGN